VANGKKTGSDYKVGKNKPPVETRFSSERQPEKNGRPKGSLSLGTRVRAQKTPAISTRWVEENIG
jgi:hypothetical protein